MDALYVIAVAVVLIVVLVAVFALLTYIFLSIFRRPSAGETVKAMQKKRKGK